MLNTVPLFFPSGAVYPISAFPPWMRVLSSVNPFTYAVHGFKQLLLKKHGARGDRVTICCFFFGFTALAMKPGDIALFGGRCEVRCASHAQGIAGAP